MNTELQLLKHQILTNINPLIETHKQALITNLTTSMSILCTKYQFEYREPPDGGTMLKIMWSHKRENKTREHLLSCINYALQNQLDKKQYNNLLSSLAQYINQIIAKTTGYIQKEWTLDNSEENI